MLLFLRKQDVLFVDVEYILMYMRIRNGVMLYSDKSQFDDIREWFNMSKVVFKCVFGYLMKNGKVYQENGWIYEKKQKVVQVFYFLYKNFINKILLCIIRGDRLFCQLKDRGSFCGYLY